MTVPVGYHNIAVDLQHIDLSSSLYFSQRLFLALISHLSMASNANNDDEEVCSICLETLSQPIQLPCHHSFCSTCLEGWRSKYDARSKRTCPQCRANMPPTKEMVDQLNVNRKLCHRIEEKLSSPGPLDVEDPKFALDPEVVQAIQSIEDPDLQQQLLRAAAQSSLEKLQEAVAQMEEGVGDVENLLQDNTEDDNVDDLPDEITRAAGDNNIQSVLDWLGPPPVPTRRINAKCREHMDRTLLHEALFEGNISLMRLLLQFGANVDPKSTFGRTPFDQACCYPELDEAARLLLTWGAATDRPDEYGKLPHEVARSEGCSAKLVGLLQTPLGGRRCEIVGLKSRTDLNGKTCVATRYLRAKDLYVVDLEQQPTAEQQAKIKPANLQRRDRTPLDLGKILIYGGQTREQSNIVTESLCFRSQEESERFQVEAKRFQEQQQQQRNA
jgi:hypothetical protein